MSGVGVDLQPLLTQNLLRAQSNCSGVGRGGAVGAPLGEVVSFDRWTVIHASFNTGVP